MALYENVYYENASYYGGRREVWGDVLNFQGMFYDPPFNDRSLNDTVSSILLPKYVGIRLYKHDQSTTPNPSAYFTLDDLDLRDNFFDQDGGIVNDNTSSLLFVACVQPGTLGVTSVNNCLVTPPPNPTETGHDGYLPSPPSPGTWTVKFWNNEFLAGFPNYEGTSDLIFINELWDTQPRPGIQTDNYSSRWESTQNFDGDYHFTFRHDDGARIFIDGVLATDDQFGMGGDKTQEFDKILVGSHTIVVEHRDLSGPGILELSWELNQPPSPPTINFTALLQGRSNHSAQHTIRLVNGFGYPARETVATTDASGNFQGWQLPGVSGSGRFTIKGPAHLARLKSAIPVIEGQTTHIDFSDGGTFYLKAGDVNNDNVINSYDVRRVLSKFGTCSCIEDLNGDGTVNTLDYAIILTNWLQHGDPWPTSTSGNSNAITTSSLSGTLSLSPPVNSVTVGETFDIRLSIERGEVLISGVDAIINYDRCAMGVESVSGTRNLVDGQLGKIYLSTTSNITNSTWATITFRALASTNSSINIEYQPPSTADSNIVESGTGVDILNEVQNATVNISGTPFRPSPLGLIISPSDGSYINRSTIPIKLDVHTPCGYNEQAKADFQAFYNGTWNYIGTDNDGGDGFSINWDNSQIPDQITKVRAFISDGVVNNVASLVNENVTIDGHPPFYLSSSLQPASANPGQAVNIEISTADNLSGVNQIDVYVRLINNGSTNLEQWSKIGTIEGDSGNLTWATSSHTEGCYQIGFAIYDNAQNINDWTSGLQPQILYELGSPCGQNVYYLPIILKSD